MCVCVCGTVRVKKTQTNKMAPVLLGTECEGESRLRKRNVHYRVSRSQRGHKPPEQRERPTTRVRFRYFVSRGGGGPSDADTEEEEEEEEEVEEEEEEVEEASQHRCRLKRSRSLA